MPYLAAFTTVLLWAFAFPASKAALPFFTVEQIVLLRYIIASAFYIALFAMGMFPLPKKKDLPVISALAILGVTVYQLLFVFGLGRVTAAAASMIITANPVVVSLLARAFLKESLGWLSWVGILLSFGGVAVISLAKGADGALIGYGALLVAVVSIAIFFVFQKPYFKHYSPLSMTSYTSILGTMPLLYWIPGIIQPAMDAPVSAWISIIVMGVFSSGIGFLLWFYALSRLPAGIVSSFLFLQPVFVTVMAWFWLQEWPTNETVIGGVVVLVGVSLILYNQARQSAHTKNR
ncbi:MAG: DMT family transporter [Pseudomonadota bacterium]